MEDPYCCPNYGNCQLVKIDGFVKDDSMKEKYINEFCLAKDRNWKRCKRYCTKTTLNFCPDFVMPDTPLSYEEILDRFDELNMN